MKDGLTTFQREAIREVLAEFPQVERAVLFGSRTMGTWSPASDVDLVLFGGTLTLEDEVRIAARMEDLGLPLTVNLVRYAAVQSVEDGEHTAGCGLTFYRRQESRTDAPSESPLEGHAVGESTSPSDPAKPLATIGQLVTLQRGTTYKSSLLGSPGPVLLGLASIAPNGGFRADSLRTYGGECPPKLLLYPGDLYVSLKDVTQSANLLGAIARVPNAVVGRLTQDTVKLIRQHDDLDLTYLYWVLRTPDYRDYCRAHAIGTTNLSLSRDDFLAYPIPPATSERQLLVRLLETIEARIELNRKMNETLEAIARAIFQSWFVDFDPVHAKARGEQPAGMSADIAALFPSEFEDSELGPIPKGWGVRRVGDVAEFAYGKALKAENRRDGNVPVYGSNGPVGCHDEALVDGPGIVIGRKGNPGTVNWVEESFFPIDTTFYVISRVGQHAMRYLFFALAAMDLASLGADSAVPGLNRNMAYMNTIVVPGPEILVAFRDLLQPMDARIKTGKAQAVALAALRDLLLPKLLSGEIRLNWS